jgi:hypothetical protein
MQRGVFKEEYSEAWLYILIIPALERLRQKDQEFEASLGVHNKNPVSKQANKQKAYGGSWKCKEKSKK